MRLQLVTGAPTVPSSYKLLSRNTRTGDSGSTVYWPCEAHGWGAHGQSTGFSPSTWYWEDGDSENVMNKQNFLSYILTDCPTQLTRHGCLLDSDTMLKERSLCTVFGFLTIIRTYQPRNQRFSLRDH